MDLSNIDPQAIAQTVGGSLPAISVFLDKFGGWFGWLKQPFLTIANAQANSLAKQIETKGDIEVQRIQIRGIARLAEEAERTQKRLDAIGLKAMSQFLPDAKPQELKQDWMENFISHAAKAGDEDAETLWARILAGEVNKPGSYSKRTLEILSLMTQQEAELFVKAAQYAVNNLILIIVPRDPSFFPPDSGVSYYGFMELAALGLFHEAESQFNPFNQGPTEAYYCFSDSALAVTKSPGPSLRIGHSLSAWVMTRAGRELANLFEWKTPNGYIEFFRNGIAKLGWNSRLGKISDYSNPKFEAAPPDVMEINLPKKLRDPFAWVMRVGAATPGASAPEIKKLLESVAEKLSRGDKEVTISKDEYKSFFGPVAQSLQAFPADTNEEVRRDAHHICRMLMDSKTLESYRDKEEQKLTAGIGDAEYVVTFN
jgi:Protein of unknown function (DUF2806)